MAHRLHAKSQHREESFVYPPLLLGGHAANHVTKPSRVDGTYVLDQDARDLAEQFDLWAE